MSLRKLAVLGLLATALVVSALLAAQAQGRSNALPQFKLMTTDSEFTVDVQNAGWWDDAGTHNVGNDNYEVGVAPDLTPTILRNFFTFDGSLAPACARNAALQIPRGEGSGEFGGLTTGGTYALHDVLTPAIELNTNTTDGVTPIPPGAGLEIFADLGDGALYGSKFLPTAPPYATDSFIVQLNNAALHDLNTAILTDSFFSVGGMIAGEPDLTSLFGFTPVAGPLGDRPVNLLITPGGCNTFAGG
jgi:hypothetical protein